MGVGDQRHAPAALPFQSDHGAQMKWYEIFRLHRASNPRPSSS